MSKKFVAILSGLFVLAGFLLSGCEQELRDLKDAPLTQPDKIRLVGNVNQHPNIVVLCIEGAGFATTTRDDVALMRVEVLDRTWCGGSSQ